MQQVKLTFDGEFNGLGKNGKNVELKIGPREFAPYDLILLALGSCLYSTFLDIAKKMKIHWESVDLDLSGEKRKEIPTTLRWCRISVKIKSASHHEKIKKAFELATKYCSIYHTLSKVAEIQWEIEFY